MDVGIGKGVLVGSAVSVGEAVRVLVRVGVTLGRSHAVGVPVGVLVSSGAAVSVKAKVGLAVGVISTPASSLNTWKRSRRISNKARIANIARFIGWYFTPSRMLSLVPTLLRGHAYGTVTRFPVRKKGPLKGQWARMGSFPLNAFRSGPS